MKGKGILVKCKEEMEVTRPIPGSDRFELILFFPEILYTCLFSENRIVAIDRNHRNVILNNEQFNKHFNLI